MNRTASTLRTRPEQSRGLLIIVVTVIAVIVFGIVILLTSLNTSTGGDPLLYSDIPQSRGEDGAFVLGDPEAPVTIIEFADFGCPHCEDYQAVTERFIDLYVRTGQARFEYRLFSNPTDPVYSEYMAQIAECAGDQSKFWPAHNLIYSIADRSRFNDTTARQVATSLGLNYSELLTCAGDARQGEIDKDFGQSLNVTGTPAVRIRYGSGEATFISYGGRVYDRGSVPLEVLGAVVAQAQ